MNAVDALDPAFYGGGNPRLFQLVAQDGLYTSEEGLAFLALSFHRVMSLLVRNRVNIAEAEVFQFAAHFAHA